MLFRQLFDSGSATYTYLLASAPGGEALIIDPVFEKVEQYLALIAELDLRLVKALDTHLHADHVTGLGELRDRTRCVTVMGRESSADVVAMRVHEGETIDIAGVSLRALYTPGHTDDSYCFVLDNRVFTGDTLLIRGTGRTDLQNGDPYAAYDSLFHKLLTFPDETLVYPAHDYKGMTVSTIGEERVHNPRLQVSSAEEYAEIMNNLHLPDPKLMDVAVPSNRAIGIGQARGVNEGWAVPPAEAIAESARPDVVVVDLREDAERSHAAGIPGALAVPYGSLEAALGACGVLSAAAQAGKRLLFTCAYGERSALAVRIADEAGIAGARSLEGGMDGWLGAGGPVTYGGDST